jgi:cytochrome b561
MQQQPPQQRRRFAWPVRAIHWASAILIAVAYLSSELGEASEDGLRTGFDWHTFAGLALLVLFLPRLLAKLLPGPAPIAPPPPRWSILPGKLVSAALLLFVVVQPILGVLTVWSEGQALPVPFTSWSLPPLLALGEEAGEVFEELHEALGTAFYAVIGAHAAAALWHHLVRRDSALRRML